MALLDFIKEHQQQSQTLNVGKLPENVKAQAVEAARPAAELMEKATTPRNAPPQPFMADAAFKGPWAGVGALGGAKRAARQDAPRRTGK